MIIYQDTEKELFFEDYKPIPKQEELQKLSCTELEELYQNIGEAEGNAASNNSALLEIALFDDLIRLYRERIRIFLCFTGSGSLAQYVKSAKYNYIEKAIANGFYWLNSTDNDCIVEAIIEGFTVAQWFEKNCCN